MSEAPKVFISYSHDSPEHKAWVRKLATDLRQHMGVDVIFDQWDVRIGGNLALFMEQGLSAASLILCICSEEYVRKANEGQGGVNFERMILTQELMNNANNDYIIPVMRCNEKKSLPRFLSCKLYIDFSVDSDYLTNLGALAARIHGEDLAQKPPIGKNPFSQKLAREILAKTQIEQSAYHAPEMEGAVSFNFKNNSGQFILGVGEYEFCTKWSECGSTSIYGYSDSVKKIGYLSGISEIPQSIDFSHFDFTSRVREVHVGEVLVWMNTSGKFAATLITDVSVKSRGAEKDSLSFYYKIYAP